MPKYIMLSNLTDEGRKTVKMRPERIKEVNDEIEKMGAKVLEQYAVLGEYDFINIFKNDNPDIRSDHIGFYYKFNNDINSIVNQSIINFSTFN